MQPQNLEEYKGLRTELTTLKECITTYVGFIAAGAAVSFWGLADKMTEPEENRLGMALAAVLLAIASTFVLLLLSYKFTSHNRYAGYSKLLTHERYHLPHLDSVVCWEVCLDRLRDCDRDNANVVGYCDQIGAGIGVPNLRERFRELSGPSPRANRSPFRNGVGLLAGLSTEHSGSWHFPIYVARIIGAIDAILLILAASLVMAGPTTAGWAIAGLASGAALLAGLWCVFVRHLYRLMLGSETVDAYCWKFVPIRHRFLSALAENAPPGYRLIGVADSHAIDLALRPGQEY